MLFIGYSSAFQTIIHNKVIAEQSLIFWILVLGGFELQLASGLPGWQTSVCYILHTGSQYWYLSGLYTQPLALHHVHPQQRGQIQL